jgi:RNA polymerase sigma-70 factor (ECF subfamily)
MNFALSVARQMSAIRSAAQRTGRGAGRKGHEAAVGHGETRFLGVQIWYLHCQSAVMSGSGDNGARATPASLGAFAATHWSVVLAAAQSESPRAAAALETLCRTYWYPLYAFVRRQGHSRSDAEDLLQGFFARFVAKHYLEQVDQARGRFRSFLLGALKHYLANEWDKAQAVKRGGRVEFVSLESAAAESRYGEEPATELTPERLYEQRWACALLERVMTRLQRDCDAAGKGPPFEALKGFLLGEGGSASYARLAASHGLSAGALKMKVQRLRHRYQRLLREEIAHTVARPEEVDEEIRHLFNVLSG